MTSPYSDEALSSGPSAGTDPTMVNDQAPATLFGWAIGQNTGAPGTAGAELPTTGQTIDFTDATGRWQDRPTTMADLSGPDDSTIVPSQVHEGISGLGPADLADTGAGKGGVVSANREPGAET